MAEENKNQSPANPTPIPLRTTKTFVIKPVKRIVITNLDEEIQDINSEAESKTPVMIPKSKNSINLNLNSAFSL